MHALGDCAIRALFAVKFIKKKIKILSKSSDPAIILQAKNRWISSHLVSRGRVRQSDGSGACVRPRGRWVSHVVPGVIVRCSAHRRRRVEDDVDDLGVRFPPRHIQSGLLLLVPHLCVHARLHHQLCDLPALQGRCDVETGVAVLVRFVDASAR